MNETSTVLVIPDLSLDIPGQSGSIDDSTKIKVWLTKMSKDAPAGKRSHNHNEFNRTINIQPSDMGWCTHDKL